VLIAEDVATGQLAGGVTVSLLAAEALLPPPFPTLAQRRLYLGNMAVAPDFRRQRIASRLLSASERLGRRWGHSSLWLHFDQGNHAAEALYNNAGYETQRTDPDWQIWPKRRSLLMKQLCPVAPWPREPTSITGSSIDGVFVWEETPSNAP